MTDPQALPGEAPQADEAPAAPKRRRTKAAIAAEAALSAPEAPALEAPAADAAPKPAAKRRSRKVSAEAAGEPVLEAALETPAETPAPAPEVVVEAAPVRARRPRKPAQAPAAVEQLSLDMPASAAAAPSAPAVEAPVADVQASEGAAVEPMAQAAGDAPPARAPRERRDRRERQQGGRAPREAQAPQADSESGVQANAEEGDDEGTRLVSPVPVPVASVAQRFEEVISGEYDAQAEAGPEEEAEADKRVLRPEADAPKLHKVLAQAGIGSRRDMEQLITDGEVTVNGEVAHLGMRITHGDQIRVQGKPVKVRIAAAPARVLAYHKPVGEVVTHNDPEGRPTVFKRLPRLPQGKWLSVGRLDLNTEGLLLFTNSGDLAHQLMHPRFGVEREYAVRVLGDLDEAARAQLLEGVEIEGQKAAFKAIEDGGGVGANHWWRVTIAEGRNREVRKLFDAVGLTVSRLIRIRYGSVVLPRGLKRGVWVELDDHDVRLIRQLAGNDDRRQGQQGPKPQGQGLGAGQGQGQGQQQGKGRNKNRRQGGGAPQFGQGGQGGQGVQGGYGQGNQLQGPQNRRGTGQGPQGPGAGPQRGPKAPRVLRDDVNPDSDEPMFIPNPLEQTFDRRFATGSKRISAGFGRPSDDAFGQDRPKKGGPREPDPMQTSVGYIGADAYFRKPGGGGGGGGGGNNNNSGGGQRRRGRR